MKGDGAGSSAAGSSSTVGSDDAATSNDATSSGDEAAATSGAATMGTSSPADDRAADEDVCFGECMASLELRLPEQTDAFTILLQMPDVSDGTVQCPDGGVTGWLQSAPASVTCGDASVEIVVVDFEFPETLTVTVDDGDPQSIAPRWVDATECYIACNQAVVQL